MVTADLPAFSKPGQTLDVTVSAIEKAKSLRERTHMTPLKEQMENSMLLLK